MLSRPDAHLIRPTRRHFLQIGLAVPALHLLGSSSQAASPNGKLRTAHIGVGGMGAADLSSIASHPHVEVAALCDVDADRLASAKLQHAGAQTFRDYRQMLSDLGDKIDAVVISTPDHTHAPAT